MARRPILEFWYEFASTYSYLAALRIEAMADEAGVALVWRPFLLGPIFSAQGRSSSPFNLYPAKRPSISRATPGAAGGGGASWGGPSCSGRASRRRGGPPRPSTATPPRAATCGATWSGRRRG